MNTHVLPFEQGLDEALDLLRRGRAIAFPTDTVYGVGTDGLDAAAVLQLYTIKDRPQSQAIPLLLADSIDLGLVSSTVPAHARALAERYWPGGLTLVVPAAAHLSAALLAGGTTVAVRVPDHAALRDLIRQLGRPLAATSANLHGYANPRTAQDVVGQLGARLPLVLDGGATPGDIASTIVDVTGPTPRVLRQGVVQVEQTVLGEMS
jgi:L-threonylcarbamoyladenylate synthase